MTVAKFELAFTRYRHNLKMIENSTLTNSVQSLQEFDAKEMYLHLKNFQLNFETDEKCCFDHFRVLKAVCHAFDQVIMTIQRIGNLNG